jgi:hypothetical protein
MLVSMDTPQLPPVPFERKTSKYGLVDVLEVVPTDKGGLVQIDDREHMMFWARATDVLGFPVYNK